MHILTSFMLAQGSIFSLEASYKYENDRAT